MKLNTPITPEQKAAADAEYKRIADSQKKMIQGLAAKLENGEELTEREITRVVAVLRGAAKNISDERIGTQGVAKIPDDFPWLFENYMLNQKFESKNATLEHFAEQYGVSITALKNRLSDPASQ